GESKGLLQAYRSYSRECLTRIKAQLSAVGCQKVVLATTVSVVMAVTSVSVAYAQVFVRTWGSSGTGDGQFNQPIGVDVHGDEVYVTDGFNSRVEVFNRSGAFLREWGNFGAGDGQLNQPAGVSVQGDEVFVTDFANNRVQVFDRG